MSSSRSRTNASSLRFVSPATSSSLADANATKRPSADTEGRKLGPVWTDPPSKWDRQPLGGAAVEVVGVDARVGHRPPGHEVRRAGEERDHPAVRRDRRIEAVGVALRAVRGDAHPPGRPGRAVADEHVDEAVGIARDEVGGVRAEGDEPAVPGDRGRRALEAVLALPAAGPQRHALRRPRLRVADERVTATVRVPGDEVRRVRDERREAAVRGRRRRRSSRRRPPRRRRTPTSARRPRRRRRTPARAANTSTAANAATTRTTPTTIVPSPTRMKRRVCPRRQGTSGGW